jgi:uncharacterized protein with NRDE domain
MCSIIIVNHHYRHFPLVVASNRDESAARRSSDIQILSKEPHFIMGGRDEEKGGTWLAVNKYSLFAGITNQGIKDPKLETRGNVVLNILKCKSLKEMISFVEELDPSKYNKFNLIFGNQEKVFVAYSYLIHSMVISELPKGISLITNEMKFVGANEKHNTIHRCLDNIVGEGWSDYYSRIKNILSNSDYFLFHKARKRDNIIVGNCTVSSSILAFSDKGLERYKYINRISERKLSKDGKPLARKYKDYIDLWRMESGIKLEEESSSEE